METVLVTGDEVRRLVRMETLVEDLRERMTPSSLADFEIPLRHSFSDTAGLIMPCHHRPSRVTVTKCLSQDAARNPAIVGTVVLNSPTSPTALCADAAPVTTLRTGAVVGLATDALAVPGDVEVVLFGAGAQALDQVRGVAAVRRISRLTVVARRIEQAQDLVARVVEVLPDVEAAATTDASAALRTADVVCCATRSEAPLFEPGDVKPGVHLNAIGSYRPGMVELHPELVAGARVVAVDDLAGCVVEAGEIVDGLRTGTLQTSDLVPVGALAGADLPPRDDRPTVFKSVGTAVLDWVLMDRLARELGA